jgi:hypothetical protein
VQSRSPQPTGDRARTTAPHQKETHIVMTRDEWIAYLNTRTLTPKNASDSSPTPRKDPTTMTRIFVNESTDDTSDKSATTDAEEAAPLVGRDLFMYRQQHGGRSPEQVAADRAAPERARTAGMVNGRGEVRR